MSEILILLAALLGALVGGAVVWRWTSEPVSVGPVLPTAPSFDVLDHEFERARRYERSFSMIRLPVDRRDDAPVPDEDEARAVFASLRAIDSSWVGDDGVTLLLPEVGRAEGEACLHRLREVAPSLTSDARLAVFPDDGLTRGALLSRLAERPQASDGAAVSASRSRAARSPRLAS